MLQKPIIIVNYKTYQQGYGKAALGLTKCIEDAAKEYGASVGAAVCPTDIYYLSQETEVPIFAQHMDLIGFGSNTGYILPESVKEMGAVGTLINHSEHRLKLADIEALVRKSQELALVSCVCTNNVATSKAAAAFNPDFVAVEPPELIGGDISVSKAQPEIVSGSVASVHEVNQDVCVLCGAGVKNGEDIRKAIELGSEGVLLASGVVKASNPKEVMIDLIKGLQQ